MPLNVIEAAKISRRIAYLTQTLDQIELFFAGQPIDTARIGNAVIDDAKIADLSITNAKFANLSITNAKMDSVDAAKFTAGTLSADRIAASSITATKLNVSTLSAISANVGTMTAGSLTGLTITGGTIRTASSGTRIEMTASPNAMRMYDGSTLEITIDPNGIFSNKSLSWIRGSTVRGFTSTFSGGFWIIGANNDEMLIGNATTGGDVQIVSADDPIDINSSGDIRINGSIKTAIVSTSEGYRSLYCLESPEVWFFDFVSKPDDLPKDFAGTVESSSHVLETDQGEYMVFGKRKGHAAKRFEKKTYQQFKRNIDFWGQAHGSQ